MGIVCGISHGGLRLSVARQEARHDPVRQMGRRSSAAERIGAFYIERAEVEPPVEAVAVHELLVGSLFDEPALLEDDELIGTLHRRQAVSDNKGRAALHEPIEGFLYQRLGLVVE